MSKILNTCTNYYSCQSYELDIVKIKQDVANIRYIEISLLFPLDCITDGGSLSCRQLFIASLTFTSRSRAVSPFRRSIRVVTGDSQFTRKFCAQQWNNAASPRNTVCRRLNLRRIVQAWNCAIRECDAVLTSRDARCATNVRSSQERNHTERRPFPL